MRFFNLLILSASLSTGTLFGQTASEALRYSTFDVLGTGRSVATAGAMSPLGGDFSVINLNPAGLGTYRGSEFTLTPGYLNNGADAFLEGSGSPAQHKNSGRMFLANIGFVIASRPRHSKWKTSNFSIGITKVADFNKQFEYSGSDPGSITDRYRELAEGLAPSQLEGEAGLAYTTGAIYDFNEDLIYESDYQTSGNAPLLRRQTFESRGYSTELQFAYAANYNEKLQFGFAIGVPILSYEEQKVYREDDRDGTVQYFNSLRYEEELSTSGSGYNFKVGVIVRPWQWMHVGLAFHSKTRYALTDNFSSNFEYDYTDQTNDGPLYAESPDGSFRYNLRTPRVISGGLGAVIAKTAFLSAEIQYRDFGGARFKYTGRGNGISYEQAEREVNASIGNQLSDALTIRVGGEVAISKFRVRAGVEMDQSPYQNDSGFDPTLNAGLGYRADRFFIDLAYQRYRLEEGFLPYAVNAGPQPFVLTDIVNNRFVLTLAYRWK